MREQFTAMGYATPDPNANSNNSGRRNQATKQNVPSTIDLDSDEGLCKKSVPFRNFV